MSLKEQLKEEIRKESRKLKDMPLKDKLWYIWEYYKLHIAGALIAVLVLSVIATSIYNITIHPGLYCIVINSRSSQPLDTRILEEDFHDLMGFGKKEPVYVESMFLTFGDNATQYTYASMAKLSALVASRVLDILIGDQAAMEHYISLHGLADLSKLLPADILSAVEDRLSYAANDQGQREAVFVDISGTWLAETIHLSQEASNLAIVSNSTRTDHAISLIRYIFDL